MALKFYKCNTCGNIITKLDDSGVDCVCCGTTMEEIKPNTVDASNEKHVPVFCCEKGKITVDIGSLPHPMINEHYIAWVVLQTSLGFSIHYLDPREKPSTTFKLAKCEVPVAVYSYCNIHGLWMMEVKDEC